MAIPVNRNSLIRLRLKELTEYRICYHQIYELNYSFRTLLKSERESVLLPISILLIL